MNITATPKIIAKLANKTPPVTMGEIYECFATRDRTFLTDDRENHRTDPPTLWFISDTMMGRWLKVVFIKTTEGQIIIKSAYEPNKDEVWIYLHKSREEQ